MCTLLLRLGVNPFAVNKYIYIHTYRNYLLTPWSRILLENLTDSQLVKKFPAFYGTPKVHYRIHKFPPFAPS